MIQPTTPDLRSTVKTVVPLFDPVADGAGLAVALVARPLPALAESALPPPVLEITQISPVESLLMNSLPCLSHARPTGRKQPFGHLVLSGLVTMSMVEVVLFDEAIGVPVEEENGMATSL